VNLIQVTDGTQLWARGFDFNQAEMTEVEPEVVHSIFNEVLARLAGEPRPTLNFAAAA